MSKYMCRFYFFSLFWLLFIVPNNLFGQAQSNLSEEFLNSLDEDLRQVLTNENSDDNDEIEKLFNSRTSVENNKLILEKIRKQLERIEKNIDPDRLKEPSSLERFGERFFSSMQTTFMPINIPNITGDYLLDVGAIVEIIFTGKLKQTLELIVLRDGSISIEGFGSIKVAGLSISQAQQNISDFVSRISLGVNSFVSLKEMRDIQILVLGYVNNPGIYTMNGGSHLIQALNVSGGIAPNGSYRTILHKRNGEVLNSFDLYDLFNSGEFNSDIALRSGDTVFVPPSSFQVALSGGINSSGLFEINQGETLADLIGFAGGYESNSISDSKIEVRRYKNNSQSSIFLDKSNIANFDLQTRDSVFVPFFQLEPSKISKVKITGAVRNPGVYQINREDSFKSLLERTGGYLDDAYPFGTVFLRKSSMVLESEYDLKSYKDTAMSVLSKLGGKNSATITSDTLKFLMSEITSAKAPKGRIIGDFEIYKDNLNNVFTLQDEDEIIVPFFNNSVHIFGEFKNPGSYIYDSSKSVLNYIEDAGGLTFISRSELLAIAPNGSSDIFIYRKNVGKFFNRFNQEVKIYPGSILYASSDIGQLQNLEYAQTLTTLLSNIAITAASINSISN